MLRIVEEMRQKAARKKADEVRQTAEQIVRLETYNGEAYITVCGVRVRKVVTTSESDFDIPFDNMGEYIRRVQAEYCVEKGGVQ